MNRTPEDVAATGAAEPARDPGRHRDYLLLFARRHFPPHLRAQLGLDPSDIVQRTLQDAHRDDGQFRWGTAEEYRAWLRAILARRIAAAVRDGRRQKRDARRVQSIHAAIERSSARVEEWVDEGVPSPPARAERNEQVLRLAAALARLTDDQREAVELRYFHGLPVREVAAEMGRTVTAVGGLLSRGLTELHKQLADPPDQR